MISPYSDVQIMFFWLSPLSWRNPKQQSHATELRGTRCYSRPCAVRTHPRDSSSSIDLLSLFLFYIFPLCSVLAVAIIIFFKIFFFFYYVFLQRNSFDNNFKKIILKNYMSIVLRSYMMNLYIKSCLRSLPKYIFIEIVLKSYLDKYFYKYDKLMHQSCVTRFRRSVCMTNLCIKVV